MMEVQIYNVGLSDANVSKRELCEHIQKQIPDFVFLDAPVGKDPDQRNYIVSNAKIEATGFKPMYSLEAGIGDRIKGYTMIKKHVLWERVSVHSTEVSTSTSWLISTDAYHI
jgi:nucleoside-diphosphate-sugar epimerase